MYYNQVDVYKGMNINKTNNPHECNLCPYS